MNLSEEQRDYYIRLGKLLEYQKVEQETQRLEIANQELRRLSTEAKRVKERLKESKERSHELKDLRHYMKEYQYNMENPDPPEYLDNGKVLITVWKALPKKEEE